MTWWCSAQSTAWDWSWQAYPGVWLFLGLIAAGYVAVTRAAGEGVARPAARRDAGVAAPDPWRRWAFAGGLVALWLALDWPLGPLGAGYLASVHMVQYLLIALLAPPLLLVGLPRAVYRRLADGGRAGGSGSRSALTALRVLTHPLVGLAVFGFTVYWTHLPGVVDGLMASQLGSFALDMTWLLGGLVFWWPVVAPVPERPRFPHGLKMGYLFLATVINTLPYGFLTFAELPLYGIYELAPPVAGITTRQDQQIAGLLMKMGGGLILWSAITIQFALWYRAEQPRSEDPDGRGSPDGAEGPERAVESAS